MTTVRAIGTLSVLLIACLQAHAYDFRTENGLEGHLDGLVTFGSQIRTKDPSPAARTVALPCHVLDELN